VSDYRDLDVWRKAHVLTLEVYRLTESFPRSEKYGISSQMRRSSASIATNLAEGSGRSSDRDYARFVSNAIGSASELEYQLLLAEDLNYDRGHRTEPMRLQTAEVRRMLVALRQFLVSS
jgi:four helix bundle protein